MSEDPIRELIHNTYNIGLVIHEKPDGDAMASGAALRLAFLKIKKRPVLICKDPIPETFKFLPGVLDVKSDLKVNRYDLLIVVDCGNLSRTGFRDNLLNFSAKKPIINIDHHPKNDLHKIAQFNLVDYNATATVEVVEKFLESLNIPLDKEIATCLLTGLYTDTGGFKHANTLPRSLTNASRWLKLGAKLRLITESITNRRSIKSLKLLGIAFARLKIHQEFGLAMSAITQNDLNKANASSDEVKGIVNYFMKLPEVSTVILFFQVDDNLIRATVRNNKDQVDMKRLASLFDGRGQKEASGFTFHGKIMANSSTWDIEYE